MKTFINKLFNDDCLNILKKISDKNDKNNNTNKEVWTL